MGKYVKHGMSGTAEYEAWRNMKKRCCNKKNKNYPNWGGRGITICNEWIDDFPKFYEDMGKKPSPAHSIDRKDNEKGYSKDNCHWATRIEQGRNRRIPKTNKSGIRGVSFHKRDRIWNVSITVDGILIHLGNHRELSSAAEARRIGEIKYFGAVLT